MSEKRSDFNVKTRELSHNKNYITKKTLSEYLNDPLVLDNETQNRIISYHQNSGLTMPEYNQLQAMILMNSTLLENVTGLARSEEHTSELQSRFDLVCRLLLEKK